MLDASISHMACLTGRLRCLVPSLKSPSLPDVNPDVGLSAKFLIPNVFAWCIGMQVLIMRAFLVRVPLLASPGAVRFLSLEFTVAKCGTPE